MLSSIDAMNWQTVIQPYGEAERALGRLETTLATTPLHATWLWREITRTAVTIAQIQGDKVGVGQLRMALAGVPIDRADNTAGLAKAKRLFLAAAPLFRNSDYTDSNNALWPRFWDLGAAEDDEPAAVGQEAPEDVTGEGEGKRDRRLLRGLVQDLAGFAADGRRPPLVNILADLRRHAAVGRLPAGLVRLALPLALAEARITPKSAPGLLGGRRLPLGMSRASPDAMPLAAWLVLGLNGLAREARQSDRRLAELARQHRAWHATLAAAGLRRHARAPGALDLLAATPVVSIGLMARHLGCTHVAAGKIASRLAALGILIPATSRTRHKIFIAGDLSAKAPDHVEPDRPLVFSEPGPSVDIDRLAATLDGLFADLERLNQRVERQIKAGGRAPGRAGQKTARLR